MSLMDKPSPGSEHRFGREMASPAATAGVIGHLIYATKTRSAYTPQVTKEKKWLLGKTWVATSRTISPLTGRQILHRRTRGITYEQF